jgi:predicted metal-dependent HD superfamily phosphohydrolase
MHDLRERWNRLWQSLGAAGSPEPAFDSLAAAYGEPGRAYHNLHHVEMCLDELERAEFLAEREPELELAIWFHDAVHDPRGKDNEQRSAELAATLATQAKMAQVRPAAVRDLILATRHDATPQSTDPRLMADIDLAILGQKPAVFDAYDDAIRKEYDWVPAPAFGGERIKVLRRFLDRPHVYHTAMFRGRYETAARANLERAIQRWKNH